MTMHYQAASHIGAAEKERFVRIIAFYLPQFHPIPENDLWWGKDFTEWTNVRKATSYFPGHRQPRIPGTLGYYNLCDPETRVAQANLAKQSGIEAFCYWHYWFGDGKRLLERPFDEVLHSGQPDFPFCLCWANETWTGVWHGSPGRILIEQTYPGEEDQKRHFNLILPALRDPRYLTVNGKPLFLVYKPNNIPHVENFISHWQKMAVEAGFKGLFLVGMENKFNCKSLKHFDAVLNHGPGDYLDVKRMHHIIPRVIRRILKGRIADFLPRRLSHLIRQPARYDFTDVVKTAFQKFPKEDRYLPCILAGWDNTPRSQYRGIVFENFSPELFRTFLKKAIMRVLDRPHETRLIFIKAWNEWAEGNYLEPDTEMGTALLDVIRDEVIGHP